MNEELQILFQRYLDNDLSGNERHSFEQRLETDDEFADEFKLYCNMQAHLSARAKFEKGLHALRDVHQQISEGKPSVPVRKMNYRLLLGIAASLLIACCAYFLFRKDAGKEPLQFADVYVEPTWPTNRGDADRLGKIFSWRQNDVRRTIDSIHTTTLLNIDDKNYYLAELYLEQMQADSVLKYAGMLPMDFRLSDRRVYLYAMSYYLIDDIEELNKLKHQHPNVVKFYRLRIQELLDLLRKTQ